MFFKKSKGGVVAAWLMPWIVIAAIAMIIIEFLTVVIISFQVMYNDNEAGTSTLLQAMLNSDDCVPEAHIPFKDILAIGIAKGSAGLSSVSAIDIVDYNNVKDAKTRSWVRGVFVEDCLNKITSNMGYKGLYSFYVVYTDCATKPCRTKTAYKHTPLIDSGKVTDVAAIAIPGGGVATAYLVR